LSDRLNLISSQIHIFSVKIQIAVGGNCIFESIFGQKIVNWYECDMSLFLNSNCIWNGSQIEPKKPMTQEAKFDPTVLAPASAVA